MNNIEIKSIIDASIDNINILLPKKTNFSKDRKTLLTGSGSNIDSTIFLNLVLEIETNILKETKKEINILDILSENISADLKLSDLEKIINTALSNV